MPEVDVAINGRDYRIACEAGQEARLGELARQVDDRIRGLVSTLGNVGDDRLLVMASLLIADDLADASAALSAEGAQAETREAAVAEEIEAFARRVEGVADALERP